jgi:hypothetical protein
MRALLAAAAVLGLASAAFAQNASDELERELKDMVGKPPTKLNVEYEGLDQPNYKLVEINFTLDGQALPTPSVDKLNEGKTTIWHGDIKPGSHRLETNAVLTDVAGALFSYEAGYKWKVKNTRTFDQQPGLEVHVVVTPELNPGEKDPAKKFALRSTAEVKMLAKLEDGTMPDVPKPNLKGNETPDAGTTTIVELSPAEKAKQAADEKAAAKKAAEEEKKRQREEALAAKKAAAEEKKRQREEALAAKKAAEEEKKRQREEALAAKKAAAEDAKRQREEAAAAKKAGQGGEKVATGEKAPEAAPAPEPEAAKAPEVVDAGPAVAAAEPPKPPQPLPSPAPAPVVEDKSSMVPIIVGVAVALLGIVIFFATRRKKQPPQY